MTLVGMSNSRLACEGGLTPYKKNKKIIEVNSQVNKIIKGKTEKKINEKNIKRKTRVNMS
jgi:hypothetical protein